MGKRIYSEKREKIDYPNIKALKLNSEFKREIKY